MELLSFGCLSIGWRSHDQLYLQPESTPSKWVNGCEVMRSPIAKYGKNGDPAKITTLSTEPGKNE